MWNRGEYREGGGDTIRIAIQGRDTRYGSIQITNVIMHFMHEIPCIMLQSVLVVLRASFAVQLCITYEVTIVLEFLAKKDYWR